MTSPSESTAQTSTGKNRRDGGAGPAENSNGTRAASSPDQVGDLVRAQEDLTQEVRQLVARRLVEHGSNGDVDTSAESMLAEARAELLEQLLAEQQEQARRQLADATRSSEDAVTAVVRSFTAIVRSVVPAALVRPEDVIEATFSLADQGIRVGRRLALTVTGSTRDLIPLS